MPSLVCVRLPPPTHLPAHPCAVISSSNDNLIVWYKNGGGVTTPWTPYTLSTTAQSPFSVIAAYINSDSLLDGSWQLRAFHSVHNATVVLSR